MRSPRRARSPEPRRPPETKDDDPPLLIVPRQSADGIDRRRRIREAFHDSRAHTIRGKRGP